MVSGDYFDIGDVIHTVCATYYLVLVWEGMYIRFLAYASILGDFCCQVGFLRDARFNDKSQAGIFQFRKTSSVGISGYTNATLGIHFGITRSLNVAYSEWGEMLYLLDFGKNFPAHLLLLEVKVF